MILRSLAVVLCLLATSCGPVLRNITLPGYLDKKISGKTLVIAPYSNSPYLHYSGNVKKEFGEGNKDTLILHHFNDVFPQYIKKYSTFTSVIHDEFATPVKWQSRIYLFGGDTVNIRLPKDGTDVSFKNGTADFALFMQDMVLGTSARYIASGGTMISTGGGGMMMVGGGGSSTKIVAYSANYAFWDLEKKCPAVIGRASVFADSKGFAFVQIIRMEQWNDIDSSFAKNVIDSTPFVR
jgi:hypothetical protein